MEVVLHRPAVVTLFAVMGARGGKQGLLEVGDQADQAPQTALVLAGKADVHVEPGRAIDLGVDALEPVADGFDLTESLGALEYRADDLGGHVTGAGLDRAIALGLPAGRQLGDLNAGVV